MKKLHPSKNSDVGPLYWRSLDQLAQSPEFCTWLNEEFPEQVKEFADPVSRRHFIQIMSASFLLAGVGLTGCRRPEETVLPFPRMPENYTHGISQYFATSMPFRGGAQSLLVKSCEGRPVKIEGNPEHPFKFRGTPLAAQASILGLYDPDRAMRCTHNGNDIPRPAAIDFLSQFSKDQATRQGKNLCFLMERSSSPSRARLQTLLKQRLPQSRWFVYEPLDWNLERQASSVLLGRSVRPFYQFNQASVILSLDCDLLGAHPDSTRMTRDFAQGRQPENASANRLYAIECLMTITGANADHRLKLPSSMGYSAIGRIAQELLKQKSDGLTEQVKIFLTSISAWGNSFPGSSEWISECVRDLLSQPGKSLIMTGCHQPLAVHIAVLAMNSALGNIGKTLTFLSTPDLKEGSLQDLSKLLQSGEVENLVILGGNPVYNAPADLNWAVTQRKAKNVVRLGVYEDETFPHCDWHFPAAHYLESWGDARSSDGTLLSIQPLIAPLFGGFSELEFLARIAGIAVPNPYEIVRDTFKSYVPSTQLEGSWKRFLHDGFLSQSAQRPLQTTIIWTEALEIIKRFQPAGKNPDVNQCEFVFHSDYRIEDGAFANNGWLQELPDPITKLAWENAFLISPKTAAEWHLKQGEIIEIHQKDRVVRGPVFLQPGMAHFVVGCTLGYGRKKAGRVGQDVGFNVYPLRTGEHLGYAMTGSWKKTGAYAELTTTQEHGAMEGRAIALEANRDHYRKQPDFARKIASHSQHQDESLYPSPPLIGMQQWGMAVDMSACIGCAACMVACQSENNIPIVGKDQVKRGREMHWIRIDRYYASNPKTSEDATENPQVTFQPLMCQHCENAPCEVVCPVNATVHDEDGLNVMVYNRCVGTRYCANNCPYKARRFNHFDFNKRPLNKLYHGPLALRPAMDIETAKLAKNPDVTVRMRGVMEKCTFCVQRIEQAKINQKSKAGASGNVRIPDGTFLPACAQACPAEAIVFGDISDSNSRISKCKSQPRNYGLLDQLNTKPRNSYLARIRNPNPRMPDYQSLPASMVGIVLDEGTQPNPASVKGDR